MTAYMCEGVIECSILKAQDQRSIRDPVVVGCKITI